MQDNNSMGICTFENEKHIHNIQLLSKQSCPECWMWILTCPQGTLRCFNVLAHRVPQKHTHVHLYFNYYQLLNITVNHFLFGKANCLRPFPQGKLALPSSQPHSHCLGRILGLPQQSSAGSCRLRWDLSFKFNDYCIEMQ